jgi:hypothetical protein
MRSVVPPTADTLRLHRSRWACSTALTRVGQQGARVSAAARHRLRGACLRQPPSPAVHQALRCVPPARDVAHCQDVSGLTWRAATSLSRRWHRQGKRAEARDLLAPIDSWFTEVFDTADFQEAQALLEELGA